MNAGSATALRERPQDVGLVVVDHGSRRQESNEMLERMADMIRESVPYRVVEPAHMELAEPSIATAYARCVAADVELVVISPYFLLPGRHWSQDIPELARQAANEHPGSRYLVTAPLGLHPLMAQVVDARVRHCLAHAGGTADECEVCEGTGVCAISAG